MDHPPRGDTQPRQPRVYLDFDPLLRQVIEADKHGNGAEAGRLALQQLLSGTVSVERHIIRNQPDPPREHYEIPDYLKPVRWIGKPCKADMLPISATTPEPSAFEMGPQERVCVRASEAVDFYDRACMKALGPWCHEEGTALALGAALPADPLRAVMAFQRGCLGRVPDSCEDQGLMYESGALGSVHLDDAAQRYDVACHRDGRAYSCMRLGEIRQYIGGGAEGEPADLLTRACSLGNMRACVDVAWFYESGTRGFGKDVVHALGLYRKACDTDPQTGCAGIAHSYEVGLQVPRNIELAARIFQAKCDGGDPLACAGLAHLYSTGDGVPANAARSSGLLQRSCTLGYQWSCQELKDTPNAKASRFTFETLLRDSRGESRAVGKAIKSQAEYFAGARLFFKQLTAAVTKADGNCDKIPVNIAQVIDGDELFGRLKDYEQLHPDAGEKLHSALGREKAALDAVARAQFSRCRDNPAARELVPPLTSSPH
jgi:TPR repeat protein